MPLVTTDDLQLGPVSQLPQPQSAPSPSGLDIAAAAERQSNVVGALYDRLNTPKPVTHPPKDFDPLTQVPAGYEQYADRFLDADSPEEVTWMRDRINSEISDRETLARGGALGFVSSMAAGLTDPLTIASMAIPGGGETRLLQAARIAAINAGTSAAQEALMHQLSATRTAQESAFNIAGSAVLGGITGAALRPHIPARTATSVGDRLSAELHDPAAGDSVLGPMQRTVLDTALPSDAAPRMAEIELGNIKAEVHGKLAAEEARLRGITEGPEGQAAAMRDVTTVGERQRRAQEALDEAASRLSEDRDVQVRAEAQRLAQADQKNAYAQGRAMEAGEEKSVFPKWQQAAQEEVDRSRAQAEEQAELARKVLSSSREDMGLINKVRGAESDLEQLNLAQGSAKSLQDLVDILPEGQRTAYSRRIASLQEEAKPPESTAVQPLAPTEEHINPGGESTAGAAAVAQSTLASERIAKGARTIAEGPIGRVAPGLRLLSSPSLEARKLVQELANTPEVLEKNNAGIPTAQPIERKLWGYEGTWYQGWKERAQLFKEYRNRIAQEGGQPLSRREFNQEISFAMRRGDQHEVPEIAQAATRTRQIIFDPLKQRAQGLGLLPEDVKPTGADSYLMRQYDPRKIRDDLGRWLDTLTEGFRSQGVDVAEARDIAHQATRNVLGSERGTMDFHVMDDIVPRSGQMKERTLRLPDEVLEPWLNSDIDHLSHSYLRSMAPEVEFTERFGSRDLKDQMDSIKDEYARLMEQAKVNGQDLASLEKSMQNDIRDLSAIRDRLYGIYGAPKDPGHFFVRAGRVLRSGNALRLLGAATLAHFPDLANVITRYGMPDTFATMGKILSNSSALKLTSSEAKRMGAALDMTMNLTSSILGDYGSHSQFAEARALAKMTRAFTIGTGETPLITAVQALTSTLAQDEILRAADRLAAGQTLGKDLTTRLASAGLDPAMIERMGQQFQRFGQKANGLRFGMSDQWADKEAAQAFESAVLKEAHGVTLRPGAGDTPLLMSTELGKTILQFKTFAFAANRIVVNPLLQGLARGDLTSMQGLLALAFMGTASYVSKQKAAGQPVELNNPTRLAMEVLDKSNLMGWTSEMVFPAMWSLGMKDLSRWSDRDAMETLLGPSMGTVGSLYERRLLDRSMPGDDLDSSHKPFSRSDLHFLRRLLPAQNLWYMRNGVNALEDAIGNSFDLPGTSNKERAEATLQ